MSEAPRNQNLDKLNELKRQDHNSLAEFSLEELIELSPQLSSKEWKDYFRDMPYYESFGYRLANLYADVLTDRKEYNKRPQKISHILNTVWNGIKSSYEGGKRVQDSSKDKLPDSLRIPLERNAMTTEQEQDLVEKSVAFTVLIYGKYTRIYIRNEWNDRAGHIGEILGTEDDVFRPIKNLIDRDNG